MRQLKPWHHGVLTGVLAACVAACGGEVVGIGNSGNRMVGDGIMGEVAEALAERPETPRVTDEALDRIFAAILARATEGDPEAALIVLEVAREQREGDDD